MIWLELFGVDVDGKLVGAEHVSTPFPSPEAAIAKGRDMAATSTFSFGKAAGYRLFDESRKVVAMGSFSL